MYLSYAELWKKLSAEDIRVCDLTRESGVPMSTLDKMRNLRNVKTHELLKLCELIGCGINEIVSVRESKIAELYYSLAFNKKYHGNRKNEFITTCEFEYMGREYSVHRIRKFANSNTVIFCTTGGLLWRQIYFKMAIPGIVMFDDYEVFKVSWIDNSRVNIVIIPGVPGNINSLDEYAFTSWRNIPKAGRNLYLMTERAFRRFDPI